MTHPAPDHSFEKERTTCSPEPPDQAAVKAAEKIAAIVKACADWIRRGETNYAMPTVDDFTELIANEYAGVREALKEIANTEIEGKTSTDTVCARIKAARQMKDKARKALAQLDGGK